MGLLDIVDFEGDLPEGMKPSDSGFETKSLFRLIDRFTITGDRGNDFSALDYIDDDL